MLDAMIACGFDLHMVGMIGIDQMYDVEILPPPRISKLAIAVDTPTTTYPQIDPRAPKRVI